MMDMDGWRSVREGSSNLFILDTSHRRLTPLSRWLTSLFILPPSLFLPLCAARRMLSASRQRAVALLCHSFRGLLNFDGRV